MYDLIYDWAFAIGRKILEERKRYGDGNDLVKRILFDIRGEELPGRFLNKLSSRLADYKTNVGLNLDVSPHKEIFTKTLWGNHFYYVKAAIISGLTNALARGVDQNE